MNSIVFNFYSKGEKEFKEDYFNKSINTTRVAFLFLAVMYSLFAYLDVLSAGPLLNEFLLIRLLIVVPLFLLVFALSFLKSFQLFWQELLFISYIVAATGVILMIVQLPSESSYSNGFMLIFLSGSVFIRLRLLYSTIAGWLSIAIYNIIAIYVYHNSVDVVLINNFFFIAANLIGMFASYHLEISDKQNFNLLRQLEQKNSEIRSINSNLEIKVKERTDSLSNKNIELRNEILQRSIIEKKLEKAKLQAEQADRLKSTFLANMSHEIRTPMNGIIGFANLLNEAEDEKELNKFINIIVSSGEHLLNLINEIMDISKIEAGILKLDIVSFDLNELTKEVNDLFVIDKKVSSNKIKFTYIDGVENSKFNIKTDRMRLKQVLVNVINNACKYTEKGSVEFGYRVVNDRLEFFVKDTGVGISEEQQGYVFERFMQATLRSNNVKERAGLGLAICKTYLKIMGGDIKVRSRIGVGSEFIFYIPLETDENYII
ncbi:MAG: hypothetical protein B6I18_01000 [Bacteroidetes bacterium 4572_112]|nr:MAG: hypothetical protein B6I18_01000 [Bacteroidetes bacterium 4572_112]